MTLTSARSFSLHIVTMGASLMIVIVVCLATILNPFSVYTLFTTDTVTHIVTEKSLNKSSNIVPWLWFQQLIWSKKVSLMRKPWKLNQRLLGLIRFYSVSVRCRIAWRIQISGRYTMCFISAYLLQEYQKNESFAKTAPHYDVVDKYIHFHI